MSERRHSGGGRLRRIVLYGATRGLTEAFLGARGFLLAVLLQPAGLGAWALFRLALRYAGIFQLGVHRGLEYEAVRRQVPGGAGSARRVRGESEPERRALDAGDALLFARTTLGFVVLAFGAVAAGALVLSAFLDDPLVVQATRAFAAGAVATGIWTYAITWLRATGPFQLFVALELLGAFAHLVITIGLTALWGLPGALLGFVLAALVGVALAGRFVPIRPALSLPRLGRLLRVGFPVHLAAMLSLAVATVDRLVVAALGGLTLLGYYAFAASVASLAVTFAWVIRTVVFTDVYSQAGSEGGAAAVIEHFRSTLAPFARLYPPVLGGLAILVGPAVALLLPEYMEAVTPARIFIFTGVAAGFSTLGSVGAVAAERQRVLPAFSAAGLVLNLGLSAAALQLGFGLEGVAAAALFSRTLYGGAVLVLCAAAAAQPHPVRFVTGMTWPLLYCIGAMLVSTRPFAPESLHGAGISLLIYAVLMLPLLPLLRREIAVVSTGQA